MVDPALTDPEIAIIGYYGRFPGADNPQTFWRNIRDGVECLRPLSEAELLAHGVTASELGDPHYVRVGAVLDDIEGFDAAFFGVSAREAEVMDPQHRLFLEVCWAALEHAGYDPSGAGQSVSLFAGARTNTYLLHLAADQELVNAIGAFHLGLGNDLAFMVARVSHCLNLTGPSCAVHTACSTSLVAVHLACHSLLRGESRMALAGGVAVNVPHIRGYLWEDGSVLSREGRCRVFDAAANGTVFGSGAGVVVLKRLAHALEDGDQIHAIVKGSATNNDGATKASFTAPSVRGQSAVITDALRAAGVAPDSIDYVEAHGTGTLLGDAIEVRALTRAYRQQTKREGFCALGSVKSNVGHLDAAAGVAGLIKVIESLTHEELPPSLFFERPNPQIVFSGSPFRVNTALTPWLRGRRPRRAGISAFGVGGTNAHVIVEEAPVGEASPPGRPWQLLVWSAKSAGAREALGRQLASHLRESGDAPMMDVAYTLQVGRPRLPWRRALVARDLPDALEALDGGLADAERDDDGDDQPAMIFALPGQGAQQPGMGQQLYAGEPVYREQIDYCAELLRDALDLDLREALFGGVSADRLAETWLAQPALFATEWALIQLWSSWGIRPTALVGHSIGEYVAACYAGVFKLDDALRLVAIRGRLMHEMPRGAMLAVEIGEGAIGPWLPAASGLWLSAINGADVCTVGGDVGAIEALHERLRAAGIAAKRLRSSHAFHTPLMAPLSERYAAEVALVPRGSPRVPYIANVTGRWATEAEIADPQMWSRQICEPVQFGRGIDAAIADANTRPLIVEVGPGQGLTSLIRRRGDVATCASLGQRSQPEQQVMLRALAQLWAAGADVDWRGFHNGARRQRVALPVYPFEHKRYWIDSPAMRAPEPAQRSTVASTSRVPKVSDVEQWFWRPSWRLIPPGPPENDREISGSHWLVFADTAGVGAEIVERLRAAGANVVTVLQGEVWQQIAASTFVINPTDDAHYRRVIEQLPDQGRVDHVLHLWGVAPPPPFEANDYRWFDAFQRGALHSLVLTAHALSDLQRTPRTFAIVSNDTFAVESQDRPDPARSPAAAFSKILSQETTIASRIIDLAFRDIAAAPVPVADRVWRELAAGSEYAVAHRGSLRWVPEYESCCVAAGRPGLRGLRDRGVYLITGGLGAVGRIIALFLAETCHARLILTGRSASASPEFLEAIAAAGGEVQVVAADAGDVEQMRAAVRAGLRTYGALHGVIHAAGITSGPSLFRTIAEATPEDCRVQAAPKIGGAYVLDAVTRDLSLDFVLLLSSNAAVLGGLGFLSYAAANAAMDAFALRRGLEPAGPPWISSNWDHWPQETRKYHGVSTGMEEYAMTLPEAREALRLVLTQSEAGQTVIATGDLRARAEHWLGARGSHAQMVPGARAMPAAARDRNPRPKLRSVYVAPKGQIETLIAEVWSAFLGVAPIGRNDDFFELGGHSLMAIQLIAEVGRVLDQDVPIRALFAGPTVAQLAQACLEYVEDGGVAQRH